MVGFELKGGCNAGARFIDALQALLPRRQYRRCPVLAIHPASTTHSQLCPEDRLASGVTEGYVRLSVGIEHIDDIMADLAQALAATTSRKNAEAA